MTKLAEELATPVFTATIETDMRTYSHGYHLGTEESMARSIAEDIFKQTPKYGTVVKTIGLKYPDGTHVYFDGDWWSDEDKDHRILSANVQASNRNYSVWIYYIDTRGRVDDRMLQMSLPANNYEHAIAMRNAINNVQALKGHAHEA